MQCCQPAVEFIVLSRSFVSGPAPKASGRLGVAEHDNSRKRFPDKLMAKVPDFRTIPLLWNRGRHHHTPMFRNVTHRVHRANLVKPQNQLYHSQHETSACPISPRNLLFWI